MAWPAQAMKADTLRNGRQLTYGSYKDCSRPLRRCLKQLGNGSIEGGFNAIKTDNKALEEIATLVDIEKQVTMPSAYVICITVLVSHWAGVVQAFTHIVGHGSTNRRLPRSTALSVGVIAAC